MIHNFFTMNFLDPIHINNTGTAYAVLNSEDDTDFFHKVQLQIGDVAILMDVIEMTSFLKVVRSARESCECEKCKTKNGYKNIKCDTAFFEIKLKATPKMLDDLEELIMGVICNEEMNTILEIHDIT